MGDSKPPFCIGKKTHLFAPVGPLFSAPLAQSESASPTPDCVAFGQWSLRSTDQEKGIAFTITPSLPQTHLAQPEPEVNGHRVLAFGCGPHQPVDLRTMAELFRCCEATR